jgi:hypothetical protein
MIQYSYDALIVKEHRRRLYIKNAQINYNAKYRIDINSILDSFRSNQEKEIKLEKNRKSILKYNENTKNIPDRKNSINNKNNNNTKEFLNSNINFNIDNDIDNNNVNNNKNNNNEYKDVKFKKSLANEYQSEFKKENRRLNNFKIDLNYNTQQGNFILNFNNNNAIDSNELLLLNKRNKNLIRPKSQENLKKISIDNDNDNYNNLITNILFDNSKIISINNSNNINNSNFGIKKRSNSFSKSKNIKFYPKYFIEDDIKNLINSNNLNNNKFEINKNLNLKGNKLSDKEEIYNNDNKNKEQINLNLIMDNYNKLKSNDLNNPIRNNDNNKKSYLRSSYKIFNNENNNDIKDKENNNDNYIEKMNLGKNKNYTNNHFDLDYSNFNININNNDNTNIEINKTFNEYGFNIENNFVNTNIINDRNNYTDINYTNANKISGNGREKIKSRRNQVLSGILNFDVKLGSSHIKITDLDKSSLRKKRDSNNPEKDGN